MTHDLGLPRPDSRLLETDSGIPPVEATPVSRQSMPEDLLISPALDELMLACLKKKPKERPASARDLCDRLGQCEVESGWTREDARQWWGTRMEPESLVALVT